MPLKLDAEAIHLVEKRIPHLQSHLSLCKVDDYTQGVTQQKELNLFFQGVPLHATEGAVKEANKTLKAENIENTDVLVIYGIGLGYFYQAALKWLSGAKSRYLVFIEDDPVILASLPKTSSGKQLLKDKRVEIFFWENALSLEPLLKKIAWKFLFLRSSLIALPSYEHKKKEIFGAMQKEFSTIQHGVHLVASDFSDFGVKVFANIYSNLLQTKQVRQASSLKDCCRDIPAIIVGAGPSLQQNGHLLKNLNGKALIFAGGSALNVLDGLGIKPHIAGAIDKEAPLDVFKRQTFFEVPFFYQNRIFCENLLLASTERILVPDTGGYPLEKWISSKLGLAEDSMDIGWNVANFLTSMAILMGCRPIVFVGMDLAFAGGKSYAEGSGLPQKPHDDSLICVKDMHGKDVLTQRDWLMSAEWVGEVAKREKGRFINCTEGGLGFGQEVPNVSLQNTLPNFRSQQDLDALIHQVLQQSPTALLQREKILFCMNEVEKSLKLCDFHSDQELREMESYFAKQGDYEPSDGPFLEEIAYTELLHPLWDIWKYIFIRELAQMGEEGQFKIRMNELLFYKQAIQEHLRVIHERTL